VHYKVAGTVVDKATGERAVPKTAMAIRYEIRRKLDNGDVQFVAECRDRKRADELAQSLNQIWAGQYKVLEVVADGVPES